MKTKKLHVSTLLDTETNLKLKKMATMDNRSKSRMIAVLIKRAIKEFETEKGEILIDPEK